MDTFIEKLANIAWIVVGGLVVVIGVPWAFKRLFISVKMAAVKFKLDLWLEMIGERIGGLDAQTIEADLEKAVSVLESGNTEKFCKKDDFFVLTEAIMMDLAYGRLKSIQNERWAYAEESVILAVKRFYFYLTKTSDRYKMDPKIFLATKFKKGFDIE